MMRRWIIWILVALPLFILLLLSLPSNGTGKPTKSADTTPPAKAAIISEWAKLSGNCEGKVVFAQPPHMMVLYLHSGELRKIPNVTTGGAKGRKMRGKSPRPSWAPDGKRFVYRYDNAVYVCDEKGNKTAVSNGHMDCSDETRWSWHRENNDDWLVGPSKSGNVILVNIANPSIFKTVYDGGDVEKHCELTGQNVLVYDDGSDIYVTPAYSNLKGTRISRGQSCRPCASPDNRAAWLTVPHVKYLIHDAATGKSLGALRAPEGEEIYRLNWSNLPDFAAHMYGSEGNEKMHVRKISTGEAVFIGFGWDPDLWINKPACCWTRFARPGRFPTLRASSQTIIGSPSMGPAGGIKLFNSHYLQSRFPNGFRRKRVSFWSRRIGRGYSVPVTGAWSPYRHSG